MTLWISNFHMPGRAQQHSVEHTVHKLDSGIANAKVDQKIKPGNVSWLVKAADIAMRNNDENTATFLIDTIYSTLDFLYEMDYAGGLSEQKPRH